MRRICYLREKCELQNDMVNQEQCMNKKIKILEMHLEQKKQTIWNKITKKYF